MFDDIKERSSERVKIRIVLSAVLLFFVSLAMSCQELRYMISGKSADAALVTDQVEVTTKGDGSRIEQRVIRYSFPDAGKTRQEYARVPMNYPAPHGSTVHIQYITGRDFLSRLDGQHNYGWVAVFAGSIAGLAFGGYLLSRA